jgi:hypothetical protein
MLEYATYKILSGRINPAHVCGNMIDQRGVIEFDARFASEVHPTLINACYQCSSSQYAYCH